jgi:multidrug efflux pump subunit AcrA (membrane-fusion protein)
MHTEIDVPNPKYILVPGMYASVQIPVQTVKDSLVLPLESVRSSSETEGSVMVVNKNNQIEQRNVETGLRTPMYVQIVSGLQENELILFGEQWQYKAGQRVTPKLVQPPTME